MACVSARRRCSPANISGRPPKESSAMTENPDVPRRWPVISTILVLCAAAAMVALGVWQLQRKGEKEALIALLERNGSMSALVTYPKLPPVPDAMLFRKSSLVCLEVVRWDPRGGTDRKEIGRAH